MPDLNGREWLALAPLLILMVWMGIYPQTFLPSIGAANTAALTQMKAKVEQQVNVTPAAPSTLKVANAN
jgi:NADH-quinone oxidoreductase subunit M